MLTENQIKEVIAQIESERLEAPYETHRQHVQQLRRRRNETRRYDLFFIVLALFIICSFLLYSGISNMFGKISGGQFETDTFLQKQRQPQQVINSVSK